MRGAGFGERPLPGAVRETQRFLDDECESERSCLNTAGFAFVAVGFQACASCSAALGRGLSLFLRSGICFFFRN